MIAAAARLVIRMIAAFVFGYIVAEIFYQWHDRRRLERCLVCGTCRCRHGSDVVSAAHPFTGSGSHYTVRPPAPGQPDIAEAWAAHGELSKR